MWRFSDCVKIFMYYGYQMSRIYVGHYVTVCIFPLRAKFQLKTTFSVSFVSVFCLFYVSFVGFFVWRRDRDSISSWFQVMWVFLVSQQQLSPLFEYLKRKLCQNKHLSNLYVGMFVIAKSTLFVQWPQKIPARDYSSCQWPIYLRLMTNTTNNYLYRVYVVAWSWETRGIEDLIVAAYRIYENGTKYTTHHNDNAIKSLAAVSQHHSQLVDFYFRL